MRWLAAIALVAWIGCSKSSKDSEKTSEGKRNGPKGTTEIEPDKEKPPAPRGPLQWETDEKAALARAEAEKRPVFIDFGAEWCQPCKDYEEKVFTDPAVIERLSAMVLLRFDVTEQTEADEAVQERYKAKTLPTLLGLSPAGDEKVRITDVLKPEAFLDALATLE